MMAERLHVAGMIAAVWLLFACQPDSSTPQGVAERFLDAHYVEINLVVAKDYCIGLALHKVEEEIRLTQGQVIDETTRMPLVLYRLIEEKSRNERRISFLYEATIDVTGAGQFKKKWLLILRKGEEGWRVWNYSEFD